MANPHEPYRPSNGTEGDCFICGWCGNCERSGGSGREDDDGLEMLGCSIVGRSMLYDIDDPEYPAEWVYGEDGPECTAFVPQGDPLPTPRCPGTADMFGEGED